MDRPVRVRFAPSPTGPLHIGGARTALFNWLFTRHHGGQFILRIEDTDRSRYVPGSVELITEGLRWLGLDWDEGPQVGGEYGPYTQSERLEHYHKWANWLVEHGKAYRCYCTSERLAEARAKGVKGYDRHCRHLSAEDRAKHDANGDSFVVRFMMPVDGSTTVHDEIRGDITVDNRNLTDLVLLKSDGFPTYHLANVVDDTMMEITHIMRAEEWISTAPVHKQMYDAFGWEMPKIGHLPVILNPNGKGKLSKRSSGFTQDGRKIPVLLHEFREAGYQPEALVNFLTNIGWSFGDDREVFPVEESIKRFDLKRVNPAGGKFPLEKLDWLNGVYIRQMPAKEILPLIKVALEDAGYTVQDDVLAQALPLVQDRLHMIEDVVARAGFFFDETITYNPADLIQKKMDRSSTELALTTSAEMLAALPEFTGEVIEAKLRELAGTLDLKNRQLFGVLRVAITGLEVAPPLFETLAIVGREVALARLATAQELLKTAVVNS